MIGDDNLNQDVCQKLFIFQGVQLEENCNETKDNIDFHYEF